MAYPDSLRAALETALLDVQQPIELEGLVVQVTNDGEPFGDDSWLLGSET